MKNPKERIEALIRAIECGEVLPEQAWDSISDLKDEYVAQSGEQSWHPYIGHRFQRVIHAIVAGYIKKLKDEDSSLSGLEILTESQAKRHEVIARKLSVRYGDLLLLPDVDSVLVWFDSDRSWESEILAIVSCKTSLRERIAQSCYWKLKLLSSDATKGIRVFLATTDNDGDFVLKDNDKRYRGMHRNRVISEHELDGVYVLREDFNAGWESSRVKRFERIFADLTQMVKDRGPV